MPEAPLEKLPPEILTCSLSFLDAAALKSLLTVSKPIYRTVIGYCRQLIQDHFHQTYPYAKHLLAALYTQHHFTDRLSYYLNIALGNFTGLRNLLAPYTSILCYYPRYEPAISKSISFGLFQQVQRQNKTIYLTETIANTAILNAYHIDHYQSITMPISEINFEELLRNGRLLIKKSANYTAIPSFKKTTYSTA